MKIKSPHSSKHREKLQTWVCSVRSTWSRAYITIYLNKCAMVHKCTYLSYCLKRSRRPAPKNVVYTIKIEFEARKWSRSLRCSWKIFGLRAPSIVCSKSILISLVQLFSITQTLADILYHMCTGWSQLQLCAGVVHKHSKIYIFAHKPNVKRKKKYVWSKEV